MEQIREAKITITLLGPNDEHVCINKRFINDIDDPPEEFRNKTVRLVQFFMTSPLPIERDGLIVLIPTERLLLGEIEFLAESQPGKEE